MDRMVTQAHGIGSSEVTIEDNDVSHEPAVAAGGISTGKIQALKDGLLSRIKGSFVSAAYDKYQLNPVDLGCDPGHGGNGVAYR